MAVIADVCAAVGITNARDAARRAKDRITTAGIHDVGITDIMLTVPYGKDGAERKRKVVVCTEQTMYMMLMQSDKPEAVRFQYWLASEVLPKLREAAGFEQHQALAFALSAKNYRLNSKRLLEALELEDAELKAKACMKAARMAQKVAANTLGVPLTQTNCKKETLKKEHPELVEQYDKAHEKAVDFLVHREQYGCAADAKERYYKQFEKKGKIGV